MIDYNAVHDIFPRCDVLVNGDNVFVTFNDNEWITQCISGENKIAFSVLLQQCDAFKIKTNKSSNIIFGFLCKGSYAKQNSLVSRIEKVEKVKEERLTSYDNIDNFLSNFSDLDFLDDETLRKRLFDVITSMNPQRTIYDISSLERWYELKILADEFSNITGSDILFFDPDEFGDGIIEARLPIAERIDITKKVMGVFRNMVSISSEISFECCVSEGFVNINFCI